MLKHSNLCNYYIFLYCTVVVMYKQFFYFMSLYSTCWSIETCTVVELFLWTIILQKDHNHFKSLYSTHAKIFRYEQFSRSCSLYNSCTMISTILGHCTIHVKIFWFVHEKKEKVIIYTYTIVLNHLWSLQNIISYGGKR